MQLPPQQADRISGSADGIDGAIAGSIHNQSDWHVTIFVLEVHVFPSSADGSSVSTEHLVRLSDPLPPGTPHCQKVPALEILRCTATRAGVVSCRAGMAE